MEPNNPVAYSQRPKVFPKILVTIIALAIGFGGGIFFQKSKNYTPVIDNVINADKEKPEGVNFSMFWEVWDLLNQHFVDTNKLDTQKMLYGAIAGLVDSLGDPYTTFFEPKESEQFAQQIKGAFGGVGIEIGERNNVLTVIAPIKDSPADKAGILAGDTILKIEAESTAGMNVGDAVERIRGEKGTPVTLTIGRSSFKEPREFKLIRDTIKIPAVSWSMLDGNVAHLKVYVFNQNVDAEFKKAASEIVNSPAKKIILDLRNNPGGLLDSAVDLAGYFLDEGATVIIQRQADGKETIFRTDHKPMLKTYPVVILVNKGSASASEILAGALRDTRHITVVGETSFGKGSVQNIFELPNGSSIKITFAKWFTPNGTSINENGIKPDIEIIKTDKDIEEKLDPQLEEALGIIKNL